MSGATGPSRRQDRRRRRGWRRSSHPDTPPTDEQVFDECGGGSPPGRLGVVMAFLPPGDPQAGEQLVTEALAQEGVHFLAWRSVPTDPDALSPRARQLMPVIHQALVSVPGDIGSEEFERLMLLARKRMEKGGEDLEFFSIPSASARTVVYTRVYSPLSGSEISIGIWETPTIRLHSPFSISVIRPTPSLPGRSPSLSALWPTTGSPWVLGLPKPIRRSPPTGCGERWSWRRMEGCAPAGMW